MSEPSIQTSETEDLETAEHIQISETEDLEADKQQWKETLTDMIIQMMFVSGETVEASAETTGMIEEIVRQQVIEMVIDSDSVAL